MNIILSAILLVVAFFYMLMNMLAGLLFLPVLVVLSVIGIGMSRKSTRVVDHIEIVDHHIHVPLESVPTEYNEVYRQYLKSPEWRAFRKLVLKRDSYKCVDCRVKAYHKDYCPTGEKLQVHHIHYDGIETMTFSIDQCVSVCKECHELRHRR